MKKLRLTDAVKKDLQVKPVNEIQDVPKSQVHPFVISQMRDICNNFKPYLESKNDIKFDMEIIKSYAYQLIKTINKYHK